MANGDCHGNEWTLSCLYVPFNFNSFKLYLFEGRGTYILYLKSLIEPITLYIPSQWICWIFHLEFSSFTIYISVVCGDEMD